MLWALAKLSEAGAPASSAVQEAMGQDGATMRSLVERFAAVVDNATPQNVSNTLWALAKLSEAD